MSDNILQTAEGAIGAAFSAATPIGAGIQLAGTIANGIASYLERKDRDEPDKYAHQKTVELQNFFADNKLDTDEFRLWLDGLFNDAGESLTPTSDPITGRRELLHSLIGCAVKLVYERKIASRYLAKIK